MLYLQIFLTTTYWQVKMKSRVTTGIISRLQEPLRWCTLLQAQHCWGSWRTTGPRQPVFSGRPREPEAQGLTWSSIRMNLIEFVVFINNIQNSIHYYIFVWLNDSVICNVWQSISHRDHSLTYVWVALMFIHTYPWHVLFISVKFDQYLWWTIQIPSIWLAIHPLQYYNFASLSLQYMFLQHIYSSIVISFTVANYILTVSRMPGGDMVVMLFECFSGHLQFSNSKLRH